MVLLVKSDVNLFISDQYNSKITFDGTFNSKNKQIKAT